LALVAGNSSWNLLAFVVGVLANLITMPFVIQRLGILQLGICGLFIALSTPLSLVGAALGQAAAQGIARYRSGSDQSDQSVTLQFCAAIFAIAGLSVAAVGTTLALVSPSILRLLSPMYEGVAGSLHRVSLTLALGWGAQQFSLLMQGIHVGCQAYRRVAAVNTVGSLGAVALIFSLVGGMPKVEGYILALAAGYCFTALLWLVSISAGFRWCVVRPRLLSPMSRSIGSFVGWQMLAQLVANVSNQVDRYLLGAWVNPSAVGYYSVSQRVEEVAYIGVLRAGDALFPQFSQNADATVERRAEIYFRACWMLNLLAAMVLAPLLPWAQMLLTVWVGADAASHATRVLQVLTVGGLLGCAGNVFGLYAMGVAKTRYIAMLSLTTAVTNALASVLLLRRYGFAAAGVGGVIAMLVNVIAIVALTKHHFAGHATIARLLTGMLLPIACGLAVAGLLVSLPLPSPRGWVGLLSAYFVTSLLILLVTALLTGCIRAGRSSLHDLSGLLRLPILWLSKQRSGA
jgi:O-antigen/teichoic acid export membrane protein